VVEYKLTDSIQSVKSTKIIVVAYKTQ